LALPLLGLSMLLRNIITSHFLSMAALLILFCKFVYSLLFFSLKTMLRNNIYMPVRVFLDCTFVLPCIGACQINSYTNTFFTGTVILGVVSTNAYLAISQFCKLRAEKILADREEGDK